MFLFFTVLLGWVTLHLTGVEHSVIGRLSVPSVDRGSPPARLEHGDC